LLEPGCRVLRGAPAARGEVGELEGADVGVYGGISLKSVREL
jgi:hypothetical protein